MPANPGSSSPGASTGGAPETGGPPEPNTGGKESATKAEGTLRRRDRLRRATVAEIKALAWRQLAATGPASLSLRAVAREMGMTSSALYRYFTSRDELLGELCADGFAALADTLEAAEARIDRQGLPPDRRWMDVAQVYRRWLLDHPTEFSVMFGNPIPGFEDKGAASDVQMKRGVAVLFRVMLAIEAVRPAEQNLLTGTLSPGLLARFEAWDEELGTSLSPVALAGCLFAWTQVHGAVAIEALHHLPQQFRHSDDLFTQQMRAVLLLIGCPSSV